MSRDLDRKLSTREYGAVRDWLDNTEEPFHIMRDHPLHGTEILAGMWGARMDLGHRTMFHNLMISLLQDVSEETLRIMCSRV